LFSNRIIKFIIVLSITLIFAIFSFAQEEIQGEWVGKQENGSLVWTFVFNDGQIKVGNNKIEKLYEGYYVIREDKEPKEVDITIVDALNPEIKGEKIVGIYRIKKKKLNILLNAPGLEERPKAFRKKSESGVGRLWVLEKKE